MRSRPNCRVSTVVATAAAQGAAVERWAPATVWASQGGCGVCKNYLHSLVFISTRIAIIFTFLSSAAHIRRMHSHERRKGQGLHRERRRWHNRKLRQHAEYRHGHGCRLKHRLCALCRHRGLCTLVSTTLVCLILLGRRMDVAVSGLLEAAYHHGPQYGCILRRVPRAW